MRTTGDTASQRDSVAVAYLDFDWVLALLNFANIYAQNPCLRIPSSYISEDSEVRDVWFDHERNAFGILIYHPDFEVVTPGNMPPEIEGMWKSELIEIQGCECQKPEAQRDEEPLLL